MDGLVRELAREDRRLEAHPLHDQPPQRHERGAHRRARRGGKAHAFPPPCPCNRATTAFSKAMNRSHSSRQLSAHQSNASPRNGPARHRVVRRLHRRLPRRDGCRIRRYAQDLIEQDTLCAMAYSPSNIQPPPGHPGGRRWIDQIPGRRDGRPACPRLQALHQSNIRQEFNAATCGPHHAADPAGAQGQAIDGQLIGKIALAPIGGCNRAGAFAIGDMVEVRYRVAGRQ